MAGNRQVIGADLDRFHISGLHFVPQTDRRLDRRMRVPAGGIGLCVGFHDGVGAVQQHGLQIHIRVSGHHPEESAAAERVGVAPEAGFPELEGGQGQQRGLRHIVGLQLAAAVENLQHAACRHGSSREGMEALLFAEPQKIACRYGRAQGPAGACGMVAQRLVSRLDGHRHRIGCFVSDDGGLQHLLSADPVPLRQRDQQAEDRGAQVDDPAVRAVVKVQRMRVQAVQEHRFLQRQVPARADRPKFSFLRHGKVEVAQKLVPLKRRAGTGHGKVIQQTPLRPFHDLLRKTALPDAVDALQEFH